MLQFTVQYYNVKKINFHKAIQILLLVVMTLTSTGFTAVVSYCTMSKSAVCCCDMENSCKNAMPSKSQSIKGVNSSCFSERIAGGINDIKATLSSEIVTKTLILSFEVVLPELQHLNVSSETVSHSFFSSKDDNPPRVDIYIRVSSFLI